MPTARRCIIAVALLSLCGLTCGVLTSRAASASSVAAMRWQRRVILISAPRANDSHLVAQNKILADWRDGGERDVSIVEVAGEVVIGAADTALQLRDTYSLHPDRFEVLLIGKDGGVKLRSARPFSADELTHTIDAMPMRRGGAR